MKVFRQIRVRMLKENRTTRYLLYAIGEIFLVVIGILIALQVSTWNQERQARNKEKVLLQELHEEFKANKAQLEEVISFHRKAMMSAKAIIAEFPIKVDSLDLDSFQVKSKGMGYRYTFNPSQGIINSLVNTSSFELISDPELRKLLVSWNDVLADYQEEEKIASQVLIGTITPYLIKHFAFFDGLQDPRIDLSFLESTEYENLVILRHMNLKDILGTNGVNGELGVIQETIDRIIALSAPMEE